MGFSVPISPSPTSDERELLLGFVRWQREQVVATTDGLSEDQMRWISDGRLLPIIGIINHLTRMEWRWVEGRYLGSPFPQREPNEFAIDFSRTSDDVIEAYWRQAQRTEQIVDDAESLSDPCLGDEGGRGPAHVLLGFDEPISL